MKTKWKKRASCEASGSLLDLILDVREIPEEKRETYLKPTFSDLYDYKLLPEIDKAVERILRALSENERITVYSDYDCDGTIGAAILIRYLRSLGVNVDYYIPNRLEEGYGLNKNAIDKICERGSNLVITVDNGISSAGEAEYIREKGMDLIITDHHEEQEILPSAIAVIDCKRKDSIYPFRELCGAAVALKLVLALDKDLNSGYNIDELIEMAMLSTVADIVPLIDENRTLVKLGIESFKRSGFYHSGLKRLYELADLDELTSGIIAYRLAPAINAAGRLGEVDDVMELLIDENLEKAQNLFEKNEKRSKIEDELTKSALEIIHSKKLYKNDIIVVEGEGWHTGVIGIVASRIQEYWHKPVIVIGYDENGLGRGSCRSIKDFNIFTCLSSCADVFESFGGHSLAAGFSIKRENAPKLKNELEEYTRKIDMKSLFTKEYIYDIELDPTCLTLEDVESLSKLEPFGVGNPAPIFKCKIGKVSGIRTMGKEGKHLSFYADGVRAVFFNKAEEFKNILGDYITILAKAEINCYNNRKKLQLNVKDIKSSPFFSFSTADELLESAVSSTALAAELCEYDNSPKIYLERSKLVTLYNLIRKTKERGFTPEDYTRLTQESAFTLAAGLKILNEAELVEYSFLDDTLFCNLIPTTEKKDLTQTPTYKRIKNTKEIIDEL